MAGAIIGPRYVGTYLPTFIAGETYSLEGSVARLQREPERLLVTISTPQGALLAIFTQKVSEIELLLAEGDLVTVALRQYEPFITNPRIEKVMKISDFSSHDPIDPLAPAERGGGL